MVKPSEPWHGTLSGYSNHKCRCEECRAANKKYRHEYHLRNRNRVNAYNKAYHEKNKEHLRKVAKAYASDPVNQERRRAVKFGITVEQLRCLLARNMCQICKTLEPGGNGGWHIDHDHTCCPDTKGCCGKCIRGILCHKCNVGLGHFDDDTGRMERAVAYLKSDERVY